MELQSSPTASKKLWNILRVAFFMMRKGFMSKRKLIMDMNLMMQRGKVLGKSLGKNLAFHPRTSGSSMRSFGLHEYEFSCNTSPNPIHFRANSMRKHSYFPCMGGSAANELPDKSPGPVTVLPRIEYSPRSRSGTAALASAGGDLTPGEERCTRIPSPFSVRVRTIRWRRKGTESETRWTTGLRSSSRGSTSSCMLRDRLDCFSTRRNNIKKCFLEAPN